MTVSRDATDLLGVDITSITPKELDNHIEKLKEYRKQHTGQKNMSSNECSMLLMMCISEKNARSSTSLGKRAIWIAVISCIVSAAGIIFPLFR